MTRRDAVDLGQITPERLFDAVRGAELRMANGSAIWGQRCAAHKVIIVRQMVTDDLLWTTQLG